MTEQLAETPRLDDDHPWPGLEAYDEDARDYFRGRDAEQAQLLQLIRHNAFVCLYGKSGLGKSSLLKAGVFPTLRRLRFLPVYLRLDFTERASPPLEQALGLLRQAAEQAHVDAPAPVPGESLWAYLQRRERPFWTVDNFPLTPVLVFDQFEEVFSRGGTADHVKLVLDGIADLVGDRLSTELAESADTVQRLNLQSQQYKVVLAFRSDFLAEVEGWENDANLPARESLHLRPMTRDVAVAAVENAGKAVLAPGVAPQIVDFVLGRDEAGAAATEVEPVLLSLCCYQLNGRRKRPALIDGELLRNVGKDILLDFYNEALAGTEPRVSVFIEDNLIQGRRYRSSYPRDEAINGKLVTAMELQRLIQHRLVRIDPQGDVPRVELIHDRLVSIVRDARDARLAREQVARSEIEATEKLEREREAERIKHAQFARVAAERETRRVGHWRNAMGVALILVVVLAVGIWYQRELTARALDRSQGFLLAARGQSILAGTSEGTDAEAYQDLLFSHSLLPGGENLGVLFEALVARQHLRGFEPVVFNEGAGVIGLAVSPDGRWLAVGRRDGKVSMRDLSGLLALSDATPGVPPLQPGSPMQGHDASASAPIPYVRSLVFSSDGKRLFTGGGEGTVRRWTTRPLAVDGAPMAGHAGPVLGIALSADGEQIASGGMDGTVRLWSADTGMPEQTVQPSPPYPGAAYAVGYRPLAPNELFAAHKGRKEGGSYLQVIELSASAGRTDASVKDVNYYAHFDDTLSLAFSARGNFVVSGGHDDTVRVRDLTRPSNDPNSIVRMNGHQGPVWSVAFSPDSRWVASAGADKTVRLWRAATGDQLGLPLLGHGMGVPAVLFTPDNRWLISGSVDGTVRLWPLAPAWQPGAREWTTPQARVRNAAVARDGHLVAIALRGGGTVLLRDDEKGQPSDPAPMIDVSFPPASQEDADRCKRSAGSDDLPTTTPNRAADDDGARLCLPTALALRGDGAQLVTVYRNGSLRRWDVSTLKLMEPPIQVGKWPLKAVAWSGDGRHLAVLDDQAGQMLFALNPSGGLDRLPPIKAAEGLDLDGATVIALNADGTRIALAGVGQRASKGASASDSAAASASASADPGKPWLRVLEPGHPPAPLFTGVIELPSALAFGADGIELMSGSRIGNVRLWDSRSGQALTKPMPAHINGAESITLSADGRRFLSIGPAGLVRAWPARQDEWAVLMCAKLKSNPSRKAFKTWGVKSDYRCLCADLPIEPDDPPTSGVGPAPPKRCEKAG